MARNEYTTNRTYRHLTREKRAQIEVLLQLKLSKSRIAREVGIARSTLYNELARGTVQQLGRNPEPYTRYFGDSGQRVYEHRRRNSHCPIRLPKAKKFEYFAVKQILTNIEARPQVVNQREEFGHWEIDTVVGRKESQSVLLTLDERTTRFRHIIKIPGRSTQAVEQCLKMLRELYGERFSQVCRSITIPTILIYYAHPYSAYERGLNEKQNSLIRRFLPKGRSFDVVTDEQIREIQDWINQLPRKSIHCSSPED